MRDPHPFAGNPLDRGERERRDEAWIAAAGQAAGSRFLPFNDLEVLIDDARPQPRLGWLDADRIRSLAPGVEPLFLGLLEGAAHFVADLSRDAAAVARIAAEPGRRFADCRTAGGVLAGPETGISPRPGRTWTGTAGTASARCAGSPPWCGAAARCAPVPPAAPSTSRAPIRW